MMKREIFNLDEADKIINQTIVTILSTLELRCQMKLIFQVIRTFIKEIRKNIHTAFKKCS